MTDMTDAELQERAEALYAEHGDLCIKAAHWGMLSVCGVQIKHVVPMDILPVLADLAVYSPLAGLEIVFEAALLAARADERAMAYSAMQEVIEEKVLAEQERCADALACRGCPKGRSITCPNDAPCARQTHWREKLNAIRNPPAETGKDTDLIIGGPSKVVEL